MKEIIQEIIDSTNYTDKIEDNIILASNYYRNHKNDDIIYIPNEYTNFIGFINRYDIIIINDKKYDNMYNDNISIEDNKIIYGVSTISNYNISTLTEDYIRNSFTLDMYKYYNIFHNIIEKKYSNKLLKDIFSLFYNRNSTLDIIEKDLLDISKIYNIEDNIEQIKLYYQYKNIICDNLCYSIC